jgi:nanoRNase/pAp phosphatase (c-di-AMP/oligoRNAs hydrolase)
MFASETGNALVNKEKRIGIAIVWYSEGGAIKVSLRSTDKFDVSKLAEKYGGGGHKKAAGFIIKDFKDIPWKLIKK